MADKNYVGSGFEKVFDNGGSVINCRIKMADLDTIPVDDEGFIHLVVGAKREPKAGKPTHWVAEDTYRRDRAANETPGNAPLTEEDLPF